jgi:hypothetical protein
VFRVLRDRPRAIALIDGVFESQPSVWHHELLAAQAAGVTVYGASSMGALRAAELPGVVRPVGLIAKRFASGRWNDDAFVALLHGDASTGFRPLTLPHVNVLLTAEAAVRRRALTAARARQLAAASEAQFYQSRTWATVLGVLRWPAAEVARLTAFVAAHAVDQKALDAAACLEALARAPRRRPPRPGEFSSFVRRARIEAPAVAPRAREGLERAGLRTLLLASFARAAGLEADPRRARWWFDRLPVAGWADDERALAAATLALEDAVLEGSQHFVSDGPSALEGLRLEVQRRRALKEAGRR